VARNHDFSAVFSSLDQLSIPATVPSKLSFNLSGRLWKLRLQKVVSMLSHGLFLGPAIKILCAVIPKNNLATAETTDENGIIAREQQSGLFFDDLFDDVAAVQVPLTVFAHHQSQPGATSHGIPRFAKMFLENINESRFVVSFHEALLLNVFAELSQPVARSA
jgi:hypothetical protein